MRNPLMLLTFLLAGAVLVGFAVISHCRHPSPVVVKLRIAVTPPEESAFVASQMGSSRFKYLAGKLAGLQPSEAQKLTAKPLANSALVEGEIHILSRPAAEKYVGGFVETLQLVCGTQAQVAAAETLLK